MRVKNREMVRLRNRVFVWLRVLERQGQAVTFTRLTCPSGVSADELLRAVRPARGASYMAIVGVAPASLGAPHVHVLHTGKVRCAIDHERHSQPVRAGAGSSLRLARYVARHLAQRPARVARAWRASQDFPRERALGLPPVLAGLPSVEGRHVHAGLYWHAKAHGLPVRLRVAVRVRGERVDVGEDVPLFWCDKTGLYWPDGPAWRAKDNPRSSQHWRKCRDAARHANRRAAAAAAAVGQNGLEIVAQDVLRQGFKQRFRCYWCDRSLLTRGGPAWEMDHMRPLARGGPNVPANLVLACPSCNHAKSRLTPLAFVYRLAAHGIASREVKRRGIPVQRAIWRG